MTASGENDRCGYGISLTSLPYLRMVFSLRSNRKISTEVPSRNRRRNCRPAWQALPSPPRQSCIVMQEIEGNEFDLD